MRTTKKGRRNLYLCKSFSILHCIFIICLHGRGIIFSFWLVWLGTVLLRGWSLSLLCNGLVYIHPRLRRGKLGDGVSRFFGIMDRTRTGVILCFGCLSLRLLASLLFNHSPPKFPNLVNCGIALANESTPLLLTGFSRLEDQTLSISW
jgi:hypothetical protein